MKQIIDAWVVKSLFEDGIRLVKAEWGPDNANWISFFTSDSKFRQFAVGHDWYRTEQEAFAQVERVRAFKLGVLQREIDLISGLVFEVKDER